MAPSGLIMDLLDACYFSEKFSGFDHCGWVLLSNSPQPHLGECRLFWMVSGGPYRKEGLHSTWVRSDFSQVIPWQLKVFLAAGIDLHADSDSNSWKSKGILQFCIYFVFL